MKFVEDIRSIQHLYQTTRMLIPMGIEYINMGFTNDTIQ